MLDWEIESPGAAAALAFQTGPVIEGEKKRKAVKG